MRISSCSCWQENVFPRPAVSRGDRRFCSICQQAEDKSLGHEPKTWGHRGAAAAGSQSVSTAYRGGGLLLCRSERQQTAPSVSRSSGFHHSDERHGLRAGGLGYPDTGEKGVNTEGWATASTPQSLPATVPREHYTSGLAHLLSSMETGVFRTTEGKLRRDIVI